MTGVQFTNRQPHIQYAPAHLTLDAIPQFIKETAKKPECKLTKGPPELVVCFVPRKPSVQYGAIKVRLMVERRAT